MAKHNVEIFGADCPLCEKAKETVNKAACEECNVSILDINESSVYARAEKLGIRSVPGVVIDGKLSDCCSVAGIDEDRLKVQLS